MAAKKITVTATGLAIQPRTIVAQTAKMLLASGILAVFLTWLFH